MNTDQDLESMLWLARQTSFMAGREAERERIIKLIEADKCDLGDSCTCGTSIKYIVALIKGENK